MNEPSELTLEFVKKSSFSDFAIEIGKRCRAGESSSLCEFLVQEILCLARRKLFRNKEVENAHNHFKLGLGLGVLVAAQPSGDLQIEICKRTFDRLLFEFANDIESDSKLLLLTELCYMDQFVDGKTREYVNERFSLELQQNAWSPAIRDYLHAWSQLETFNKFKEFANIKRAESPRLILVMSAKGGTGKSITAAAIAKYLMFRGKKVGLIDLDDSGPTAQYLFNIDEVVNGMDELPPENDDGSFAWCYPTFLDVLKVKQDSVNANDSDTLSMAEEAVLTCADEPNLSVVLMPESPTFCADVARSWGQGKWHEIINSLSACVKALKKKGNCEYVIVDFAPGLYGTNGAIIKWASLSYRTTPVVMTSSRASDLATSIYEAPWLAAQFEFTWFGPLLHFVNRWHYSDPCVPKILSWADNSVKCALNASLHNHDEQHKVSSATQIHSKRFWPVMYQHALDRMPGEDDAVFSPTQVLAQLPEDEAIRTLSCLNDGDDNSSFSIDSDSLISTSWYKELSRRLDAHLDVGDE